jgi:cyanophycinase
MAGPLALAGSGEFLDVMTEIDRRLLDAAARTEGPVVVVPTASALEPGKPEEWAELGVQHFTNRLHVDAEAALVLDRATADERFVPLVERARCIYFSGGNPQYVTETLRDTPFWSAVLAAWRGGAALAGCSAGAMMLAGRLMSIVGRPGSGGAGLGLLPRTVIIPHFDRIERFRPGALHAVRAARPAGETLLGIDEQTVLLRLADGWQVAGAGGVLVARDAGERVFRAGETPDLPPPVE